MIYFNSNRHDLPSSLPIQFSLTALPADLKSQKCLCISCDITQGNDVITLRKHEALFMMSQWDQVISWGVNGTGFPYMQPASIYLKPWASLTGDGMGYTVHA